MSDSLDKFVMEYVVETRDSLKRLEALVDKMAEVEKKGNESGKTFKEVGSHVKALAEEAGGAGKVVSGLAGELAGLAAVTGPIAAVVAVVMVLKKVLGETKEVMDELMQQRDLGARTGMSALSVESITRNVSRAPGSQVGRAGAEDMITKVSGLLRSAYADPTQMNREALLLRRSGVSINGPDGKIASAKDALAQISETYKNSTQEQAHALGSLIGLSNQQTDAMRAQGKAIVDNTHLTQGEADARQKALEKANELAAASTSLSEHWRELRDDILVHVIPALDTLVKGLNSIAEVASKVGSTVHDAMSRALGFASKHVSHFQRDAGDLLHGRFGQFAKNVAEDWNDSGKDIKAASAQAKNTADKSAQDATSFAAQLDRMFNLFSQSVNQFSGAVDERQAWAAWAGEIGRAGGLGSSGNNSLGVNGVGGNKAAFDPAAYAQANEGKDAGAANNGVYATGKGPSGAPTAAPVVKVSIDSHSFDELYKQAAAATGVPAELIKKVAMAESSQNPSAVSKAGAKGLMQIMPSNYAALGITDAFNPQQNVMGGAKLLAQLRKQYGNDEDALRAYNGGQNRANWNNPETAAYVGRVMSQRASFNGESPPASMAQDPPGTAAWMSPQMKYSMDPKAKPQFNFSGGAMFDPSKGGESREKSQYLNIQKMLAERIGVPLDQVQTGNVTIGDEKYAASNIMAEMTNARTALKAKLSVPDISPMMRAQFQQQLRTTDMQMQGMMRYMPQIQSQAMPGDRNITIGQGAVQVMIDGSNVSAEDLAREINETFGKHLDEVVNGSADGISH